MNTIPRRSMLYMPGSNTRALAKARTLAADALIFDLEDAVAPDAKPAARNLVAAAAREGGYGEREVIVRVNGFGTRWLDEDIRVTATLPIQGILFPKIGSAAEAGRAVDLVEAAGAAAQVRIWFMIETPLGVLNCREICEAGPRLAGLVMGTSDLAKELRIPHTVERTGFLTALSSCVLAARAHDLAILDGVHLNLNDPGEFWLHCRQGRELGFDGKTLIHPKQIETANSVFSPTEQEVAHARAVIEAWEQAQAGGAGLCVLDGRLIENLHVEQAHGVLALHEATNREA